MTTISRPTTPPSFNYEASRRALESILWHELSLGLARQATVLIDTVAKFDGLSISIHPDASGRNLQVMVATNASDAVAIQRALMALPQADTILIGNHELDILVGVVNEPHVVVQIRY